jgi:hypothetical protein
MTTAPLGRTGRTTLLAAAAGVAAAALLSLAGGAGQAGASTPALRPVLLEDTTTTTTVPDITTTVPVTTTTVAPTTTTSTSTSTSSTTTTTHPSTTTTTVPATTTSSKTPWGLIALIVVLVIAIVAVILLYVSQNKKSAADAWRRRALPALSDAKLAREALLSPSAVADDAELRAALAVQVERASTALEHAGSTAPDPSAGGSATTAAGALRGLAFAIEADRMLRHGAGTPTGVQLAQADQARRDRDAELQGAMARLQAHVVPPTDKS